MKKFKLKTIFSLFIDKLEKPVENPDYTPKQLKIIFDRDLIILFLQKLQLG